MRSRVYIIVLLLLVCLIAVTAADPQSLTYQISGQHTGTITLMMDGTGVAQVGSSTPVLFTWDTGNGDGYYAHYWVWTVQFTVSDDGAELTSPSFPGTKGTLQRI